jgi:hypothetical protein
VGLGRLRGGTRDLAGGHVAAPVYFSKAALIWIVINNHSQSEIFLYPSPFSLNRDY